MSRLTDQLRLDGHNPEFIFRYLKWRDDATDEQVASLEGANSDLWMSGEVQLSESEIALRAWVRAQTVEMACSIIDAIASEHGSAGRLFAKKVKQALATEIEAG